MVRNGNSMSGVSSPEVLVARATKLIDNNEVEYLHTNGNTHYFKGKGHKQNDLDTYDITCEIAISNELVWACSCVYNEYHDDCKHTIACGMLMKQWVGTNKELREEHIPLSSDADVVGKVEYKVHIESDDD